MKKKISFLYMLTAIILSGALLVSCEKDRYELDMDKSVDITQFTIDGRVGVIDNETNTITVFMPAGTTALDALTPEISVSTGAIVKPASGEMVDLSAPVEYIVSAGNVYKKYQVTASVRAAEILSFSINGVEGTIDYENKTVVVPLPYGTDLTQLTPEITLSEESVISPSSGTPQNFTSPVSYTLTSGSVELVFQVSVTIAVTPDTSKGPIGNKIAFVGDANDRFSLPDDDEQAAADWFFAEYPDGEFVSWTQIIAGLVNIYHYKVIWWHYDLSSDLLAHAAHPEVTGIFSDYMKDGGNLFLSGHACQYFWSIGRFTRTYPMAIGNGGGFENGDTWSIGVNLPGVDHREHPIYQGLTFVEEDGFFTFPIIGPGWKEDHNHTILEIANAHGYANNHPGAYVGFTETNSVEWLGVWGGIRDYYMAGVLELLPTDSFRGRGVYMGIGGFEWNQNAQGTINPTGENIYQNNIQTVARNTINYLSGN